MVNRDSCSIMPTEIKRHTARKIKKRLTIFISFSPYLFHPANLYEMAVGDTTDAMKRIVIPV